VSGLLMTPLMVGSMVTSVLSGQLVTKTGKYKWYPVAGGLLMAIGMFMLSRIGVGTTRFDASLDYVVIGLGMGLLMQMVSLIAQNSVELRDMGVASSARMFFQQIGGSLGVAAFGALFASKLNSYISANGAHAGIQISGGSFDPSQVTSLPAETKQVVFAAISHAVSGVFIWGVPASLGIFVLALFIREVPLRGRTQSEEKPAPEPELIA
jgi:MFS family permease